MALNAFQTLSNIYELISLNKLIQHHQPFYYQLHLFLFKDSLACVFTLPFPLVFISFFFLVDKFTICSLYPLEEFYDEPCSRMLLRKESLIILRVTAVGAISQMELSIDNKELYD